MNTQELNMFIVEIASPSTRENLRNFRDCYLNLCSKVIHLSAQAHTKNRKAKIKLLTRKSKQLDSALLAYRSGVTDLLAYQKLAATGSMR
jgi:hypothetical protein